MPRVNLFPRSGTIFAGALIVFAAQAQAQDFSYGESLFKHNCAVCHGAEAGGDGPVAALLAAPPNDLRKLAAENNGVFPFSEVYQAIDRRRDVRAHGTQDMPIWGTLFLEEAQPQTMHPGLDAEEVVQGRILALTYFLQSIQE